MKKVSVIVPVYNVENYLDKCVKSICSQIYQNLEIILVDDGSTDSSAEMCDAYAIADARVKVIHKKNGGLADARNVGIEHAKGEYLLFIDSDDWIHQELVEKTIAIAEKEDTDVVIFDYVGVRQDGTVCSQFCANLEPMKVVSVLEEPRLITVSCSAVNKLYKTSFWKSTGLTFPKGRYYEDLGTIPKLMALAQRVVYCNENFYYYLMREGSIMHTKNFEKNYKDRTAVLDDILLFFEVKKLYERYNNELEYLIFENGYYIPSREIILNDKKSQYLEKFREYAYTRFPDLDNNVYVKDLSGKNKILWLLLKKRQYNAMLVLSYVRRLKDFVKGAGNRWN